MATLESVMAKIRNLINACNAVTGNNDTDLTRAVNVLIAGYNQGGTGDYYRYVTFMGVDNETVESTVTVSPKYSCPDSAAPKLTKESTEDTVFTQVGWSLTPDGEEVPYVLSNITKDITLYPVFEESVRYYTVRFWDGNKLCRTQQIPCGGSSDYTYHKIGHYFQRWEPEPINVKSDLDCYGVWEKASFAKDTWKQIATNCRSGNASEYYKVGDERQMRVEYDGVYDGAIGENIILKVANINADGSMYIITFNPYRSSKMMYKANFDREPDDLYASVSYIDSDVYAYLDSEYQKLPSDLRRWIRTVEKQFSFAYRYSSEKYTTLISLALWPLSRFEVFGEYYGGNHGGCYDIFKGTVDEENGVYGKMDERIVQLADGTAVTWILRDPHDYFRIDVVQVDGSLKQQYIDETQSYVVFGFCL